ncbi:hypothetical protein HOLleu_28016 [Holothuria leucospilota]|uniref:Uncharacterized protein n=1 Tax=Holothuria leucospilota TaxID=206669 RepID=A0A9Q1BR39_HOLLE|nr:hypothetical protein HOLleu_28016 [Holothuria leucospilota]
MSQTVSFDLQSPPRVFLRCNSDVPKSTLNQPFNAVIYVQMKIRYPYFGSNLSAILIFEEHFGTCPELYHLTCKHRLGCSHVAIPMCQNRL